MEHPYQRHPPGVVETGTSASYPHVADFRLATRRGLLVIPNDIAWIATFGTSDVAKSIVGQDYVIGGVIKATGPAQRSANDISDRTGSK
jgi:hypothetical protein